MTPLFKLNPIGVGTSEVESLSSYIHRLSYLHGVTVTRLLEHLRDIGERLDHLGGPSYQFGNLANAIRPNKTNAHLTRHLNMATDVGDVRNLTFQFFLSPSLSTFEPNLFATTLRWCPACFEEFRLAGLDGYYKLIWHFGFIEECPTHRVRLENKCPTCNCQQGYKNRNNTARMCQLCGSPLSRKIMPEEIIGNSWEQPYADVLELIRDIPQILSQGRPLDPLEVITDLMRPYSFVDDNGVFRDPDVLSGLIDVIYKKRKISFRFLRRMAFEEGLPISAFFLHGYLENPKSFDFIDGSERPVHKPNKREKIDHETVYREILATVEESSDMLSVRGLAKKVGVSKGYLENHFPHLTADLVERRMNAIEKAKIGRRKLAEEEAIRVCNDLFERGALSKKAAFREVAKITSLPSNLLREVIGGIVEKLQGY